LFPILILSSTPQLALFNRLLGSWVTEATHPEMPGVVVHGTATIEWLEGEKFLITRSRTDHPAFPDAITIIGDTRQDRADGHGHGDVGSSDSADSPLNMQYFDSRGVFRAFDVRMDEDAWRFWRYAPGFSQRFTGTFEDNGNTIVGQSQLRRDDVTWVDDLRITYRRQR
jgi:hypothetical protein